MDRVPGEARMYDKRQACFYCDARPLKIARHYRTHHMNESEVARIFSMKNGSLERKRELDRLRLLGNFHHNINVLSTKTGELILMRRPSTAEQLAPENFIPCSYCRGFVLQKSLWRHVKTCPFKETTSKKEEEDAKYKQLRTKGRMLILDAKCPGGNERVKKVIAGMRNDEITDAVTGDSLILQFGNSLTDKL